MARGVDTDEHRHARLLESESRIDLTSVGVDVGSATSQILFSRVTLVKFGSRYVPVDRQVSYQSPIILTPYKDGDLIDTKRLREFFDTEYAHAGVRPDEVDAGAVIFTGTALRQRNARLLADLFADQAGRLVAVSAGDELESVLAAHGCGAAALSAGRAQRLLNIDIGGGTTKLAICADGKVLGTTAVDVGSRLVVLDDERGVVRVEPAGHRAAAEIGLDLGIGGHLGDDELERLADFMVSQVLAASPLATLSREVPEAVLLRGASLGAAGTVEAVTVSGGVAEYVYGRSSADMGDLGAALAGCLARRLDGLGITPLSVPNGIRATVIGASQFATQVSGNTIYLSSPDAVPLRNVPVIAPDFTPGETVAEDELAAAITSSAKANGLVGLAGPIAIALRWNGLATYDRLSAVSRGLSQGLTEISDTDSTIVVVCDDDIGRLLGRRIAAELDGRRAVVSIDCVELRNFDFVDIGTDIAGSGAVPVVIKSLLFSAVEDASSRPGVQLESEG